MAEPSEQGDKVAYLTVKSLRHLIDYEGWGAVGKLLWRAQLGAATVGRGRRAAGHGAVLRVSNRVPARASPAGIGPGLRG
ncbi:hypothetical protein GCM10022407_11470 [Hymenobacter antarcticus]|uniref:Uncharacterized protein n=1 Tax=Hymenobacter antarcticus TaxID=486270 RepID=A0ABP7PK57_9BACT